MRKVFLMLVLAGSLQAQSLTGLDEFVAAQMKEWNVPGLAVAVIKDGKVIHAKGYGYRDVKKQLPVTTKTLFAIGSSSKAFTVMSLGVLVDAGKLDWDKPVREYLPTFRMYDAFASERMTPRDLVTHRSGLPRHDLLWYNSTFSRKEMFERLRYLEPNKDFRTTFQYQNLMFMTAGYLAGEIAGGTWESVVRERIFKPLQMTTSNFSVLESQKAPDFALPYRKVKEEVKEIPFRVIDQVGPAGSINSSIEEMSNYLMMHLSKGKFGTTQVISENNLQQMHTPQMVQPGPIRWTELGHSSYGMGWFVTSYRGHKMVHHGGNIDGFSAMVNFLPQDNIGVVVLTNLNGTPLRDFLPYNVYDRLLGLEQVDWSARFKDDQKKQEAAAEEAKKKGFTQRIAGTKPTHEIKDYAGEFEHPGYGVFRVDLDGDKLKATFNRLSSVLAHFHYDIFEAAEDPENPLNKSKITFGVGVKGDVETLALALEPSVPAIVFKRRAAGEMTSRGFLEPLTGEYQVGANVLKVTLQGDNKLVVSIQGQPPYELIPVKGTTFDLKGITGFSVEFKGSEIVLYQPNGTFTGKRK